MLALYVVTGIIGLGLIIVSAIGGMGHDLDVDHNIDIEHSVDIDHDVDVDHGFDADHAHEVAHAVSDVWLPFFSLRFWTYLLGGFGGFGVLLTLLGAGQEPTRMIASSIVGLIVGTGAASLYRWMNRNQLNSSVGERDFVGLVAKVLVAPQGNDPGKVRVEVKGDIIDMHAFPLEGHAIFQGDEVVVVSIDGTRLTVAESERYLNS